MHCVTALVAALLVGTAAARTLLQTSNATLPPLPPVLAQFKPEVEARLEHWDETIGSKPQGACGTVGQLPCGGTQCGTQTLPSGQSVQLAVNFVGRCQVPLNKCGMDGEPPCALTGWPSQIGMYDDVPHVKWAFDLGADGCVTSVFYHSMRFALDGGVCKACGAPGEQACPVAKNPYDFAPACASNIRTDPKTASVLDAASNTCVAKASTCGTLGGTDLAAGLSPACAAGTAPFPDANADGCEDHLKKDAAGNCVPCTPTGGADMSLLGTHTCGEVKDFAQLEECGSPEMPLCPTTPSRKFGCLAGTTQLHNGNNFTIGGYQNVCNYPACGGAGKQACLPEKQATQTNFFLTMLQQDLYSPPNVFTGCYPGLNLRGGICYPCGFAPDALFDPATKPAPAPANFPGGALKFTTSYPDTWDGVMETKLWRTGCDYFPCGMQNWPGITTLPYNTTLGRSQAHLLNPSLYMCVAYPLWLQPIADPWRLYSYFNQTDLGLGWTLPLGGLPGAAESSGAPAPPNFGSTVPRSSASAASLAFGLVGAVLVGTLLA